MTLKDKAGLLGQKLPLITITEKLFCLQVLNFVRMFIYEDGYIRFHFQPWPSNIRPVWATLCVGMGDGYIRFHLQPWPVYMASGGHIKAKFGSENTKMVP